MGKTVKVSDSITVDFTKVEYPPDVFVRKLDRCAVKNAVYDDICLKVGKEASKTLKPLFLAERTEITEKGEGQGQKHCIA